MENNSLLKIGIVLVLTAVASTSTRADSCAGDFTREFVTYYVKTSPLPPFAQRNETAESICEIQSKNGQRTCEVKLWGALYKPKTKKTFMQWPALIFNHGSGEEDSKDLCELGKYFAEKGYLVLVPFRRGQGDPSHHSTGTYISDLATDFAADPAHHDTTCTTKGCYTAELLRLQADEEVVFSLNYLKRLDRIKKDRLGNPLFAVGGNSYGGAVTVFFNRKEHGQAAILAVAPAAQGWAKVNFAYAASDWELGKEQESLLGMLLPAAKDAKHPAFYFQSMWDYDTRPTIDLAYAHSYGSDDPTHGQQFMSSIFPYPYPGKGKTGETNYQSAHTGFWKAPERWGPSALAFLKRYGVD